MVSEDARDTLTSVRLRDRRRIVVSIPIRMDPRIVSTRPCPSWKRSYVESAIGRHASPFLTISADSQPCTHCRSHTGATDVRARRSQDNYFPIIINSTTTSTIIAGISSARWREGSIWQDLSSEVVLRIARCFDSFVSTKHSHELYSLSTESRWCVIFNDKFFDQIEFDFPLAKISKGILFITFIEFLCISCNLIINY